MKAGATHAAVACLLFSLPAAAQEFVGSPTCAACHQQAYDAWRQSDHRHAMAVAGPDTVLGDFRDATFDYFGHRSRFYTRDGRYFVETENGQGTPQAFEISYTLGFYPLQQYLIRFPDGRVQALGISWDGRPKEDGGQRWYHLYADTEITPADPLHWTGAFQNWNSRCASCHTTDLTKNYSAQRNTYDTRWAEIDVGCEACHGAGSQHVAWAHGDTKIERKGLRTAIDKIWDPNAGQRPMPRPPGTALGAQLDVCASCHSRREELGRRDVAARLLDNYSLTPLLDGLYYADGQIRDEVYVTGSFLQSRMHQNQVSCTNCHEPHSGRPRISGNGLCLQCHEAQVFQTEKHFFHEPKSAGAQCVSCHMPERTYMGVDRRRDHSFRIPDPAASVALGVPNACTQCHKDRSNEWAAEFLAKRTGRVGPYYKHAAPLAAARRNDASAAPRLLDVAEDAGEPAILRSIALIESARFPSERHVAAVASALASQDPLIRASAASALSFFDPRQRLPYLQPLLSDPVKSVRIAAARQLNGVPTEQLPVAARAAFGSALAELEASLLYNGDMPEAMSDLGLDYAARGDLAAAEEALRQARALAPHYLAAMLNLADVYRAQRRDELGEPLLQEAVAEYPESADASHALGLLYVRTARTQESIPLFDRASRLAPTNARYVLVYALALVEVGRRAEGIAALEDAAKRFPEDPQIRDALRAYAEQR